MYLLERWPTEEYMIAEDWGGGIAMGGIDAPGALVASFKIFVSEAAAYYNRSGAPDVYLSHYAKFNLII